MAGSRKASAGAVEGEIKSISPKFYNSEDWYAVKFVASNVNSTQGKF